MPRGTPANLAPSARNHLLAALPLETCHPWLSELDLVDMPLGQVLHEPGRAQPYIYFPTTAIVSLLHVTMDGSSAESAVVGSEGIVGVSMFMGGGSLPNQAVVQSAGWGCRLRAHALKELFSNSLVGRRLLLRYAQALMTQVSQTAVCNRHHSLDEQLCRWLLMRLDRLPGQHIQVTQAQISSMLGVRREGVTEHAHKLQSVGLIRYARGHIEVLDRVGLEQRVCECYLVVKKEYDRLLHAPVGG
jgi:CRP-like cAMP-binding protein